MSNIQDLKHRRGTGDCYEQIVNERKISDALERELNAAKAEVERLCKINAFNLETTARYVAERDAARQALRDMLSQTAHIAGDVWHLPSCSTDEVKRWLKSAGLEES